MAQYIFTSPDNLGVVLANNFLSVLNPVGSGMVHLALELAVTAYANQAVLVTNSMINKNITAASGGVLADPTKINRFNPNYPDPKAEIRTGNPTVTVPTGALPIGAFPPPIAPTTGSNATVTGTSPNAVGYVLYPGQGMVLGTAAGDVNELWSIVYVWQEFPLPA